MKYLFYVLMLFSLNTLAQTQRYDLPIKSGDALRVRKNGVNVINLPVPGANDSSAKIEITYFKRSVSPVNMPPSVNAGSNQSITLPANSVTLSGTATDQDGTINSVMWNNATTLQANIVTPASLTTTITDLVQGSYIFRLTATDDNGASTSASVTVTVNGVAPPPDNSGIILEGFGANAVGGSNSTNVYHVTNTNSSGAGSLANGIGSNKTIVFDVSGTIVGRFDIVGVSYLTIDGGNNNITINGNNNGDAVSFDGSGTHHCIFKNVHVTNAGNDGINVLDGAHDITITNCTSYGNRDGNIDIAGDAINITVQYSILGNGASGWSGDMLITSTNVSVHHNLFSPATNGEVGERCPFVHANYSSVGNPNADIRNNLIWKYGRSGGSGSGYGSGIAYNATGNIVNNYYYTTGSSPENATNTDDGYGGGASGKAYIAGNISGNGANANGASNHAPYPAPTITQQDACTAARIVLQKAGPVVRNSVDNSYISAVTLPGCSTTPPPPTSCTGYIYSGWSPCDVNGMQQRSIIGYSPNGCTGQPASSPVLNQLCGTTPPPDNTGYTLVYSNDYDVASDINSNQLGRGSISTTTKKTGTGSFRSEVRAGDAPISSGWRSEQQYSTTQTPLEGIWEYDVYYENWGGFDGGGHSIQWHPNTGGASANVSLQNYSNKFDVVRAIGSQVTHQTGTLKTCASNTWYHLRWEIKFSTGSDGYIRLFVDGTQTYSFTGRTDDGSGQYLKIGQNRWPSGSGNSMQTTSVCYYDNLKIYKKN